MLSKNICADCGKTFISLTASWWCDDCREKKFKRKPKPMTNADRIRAMSDKELGRFLATVENRRSAAGGGAIWKGAAHAIEWLKQPVEEYGDG